MQPLRVVFVGVFSLLLVTAALAAPPSTAPPPTSPAPVESLGAVSPRGALFRYMKAARQARWDDAARSLDLSDIPEDERKTRGPVLARQLKIVLDRTIRFGLDTISDHPGGTIVEGLPEDVERLCTIATAAGPADITMRRVHDPAAAGRLD